jgi:hypothetical protein
MEPSPAWLDRNDYFLPPYKSHRRGGIHWLLPHGSASRDPDNREEWYIRLEDPKRRQAYKEFWDKWMTWANAQRDYLNVRRDLFLGEGVPGWLEGSAHCRGDRGFLFLRNPTRELRVARVPVNHWLGLERGERFRMMERYPAEKPIGHYRMGEELFLPVAPGATLLVEIGPAVAGPAGVRPPVPKEASIQKAFLSLKEVIKLLDTSDFWPAAPLPGRDNMPGF